MGCGFFGAEEDDVGLVIVAWKDAEAFLDFDGAELVNTDVGVEKLDRKFGHVEMLIPRRRMENHFAINELDFLLRRHLRVEPVPSLTFGLDLLLKQTHHLVEAGRVPIGSIKSSKVVINFSLP